MAFLCLKLFNCQLLSVLKLLGDFMFFPHKKFSSFSSIKFFVSFALVFYNPFKSKSPILILYILFEVDCSILSSPIILENFSIAGIVANSFKPLLLVLVKIETSILSKFLLFLLLLQHHNIIIPLLRPFVL